MPLEVTPNTSDILGYHLRAKLLLMSIIALTCGLLHRITLGYLPSLEIMQCPDKSAKEVKREVKEGSSEPGVVHLAFPGLGAVLHKRSSQYPGGKLPAQLLSDSRRVHPTTSSSSSGTLRSSSSQAQSAPMESTSSAATPSSTPTSQALAPNP